MNIPPPAGWEPEGHPTNLFKFRSLASSSAKFTRQIIVDHELFLASPLAFNDPFDALPNIVIEGTVEKQRAYFRRLTREYRSNLRRADRLRFAAAMMAKPMEEKLRHLRQGALDTARDVAVCSFAQSPAEVLMWSHYADNHAGICLRFNTANAFFRRSIPFQVRYSHERPTYNAIDPGPPSIWIDLLVTKAKFWSYENEWRIIETKGPGTRSFPPEALDAIYFGCRTSEEDKSLVRSWISERNRPVEIFQADAAVGTFDLNFTRIG